MWHVAALVFALNAQQAGLSPPPAAFAFLARGDTCFLAHIQSSSSIPTGLPCLSANFIDGMDSVSSDGSDPCAHPHAMNKSLMGKLAMGRESRAPAEGPPSQSTHAGSLPVHTNSTVHTPHSCRNTAHRTLVITVRTWTMTPTFSPLLLHADPCFSRLQMPASSACGCLLI